MGPVHNRFHRGECITWASGGGGGPGHPWALKWHPAKRVLFGWAQECPGSLPPTGPSNAFAPMKSIMHKAIKCKWGESRAHTVVWGPYCCVVLLWRFQLVGAGLGVWGRFWPPAHITLLVSVPSGLVWCKHLLSLSLALFCSPWRPLCLTRRFSASLLRRASSSTRCIQNQSEKCE